MDDLLDVFNNCSLHDRKQNYRKLRKISEDAYDFYCGHTSSFDFDNALFFYQEIKHYVYFKKYPNIQRDVNRICDSFDDTSFDLVLLLAQTGQKIVDIVESETYEINSN